MNKSDADKMFYISENTTGAQSDSKEEAYDQPILWPSLKQNNKNEYELRQQLLDEFIDLQLHPLQNIQANYGQKEDCDESEYGTDSSRPKRRTLDKMRTWQVVMKIPRSAKCPNLDTQWSDPQQVQSPDSPSSPASPTDELMESPSSVQLNPDGEETVPQDSSQMSPSDLLTSQVEQNMNNFEKSKEKYWNKKSKKSKGSKQSPQQTDSSSDGDYTVSRKCHSGQRLYLRIIFSDNHPKTKPQLGFSRKQSQMYEARDFCCFQKYINMSNYEWKKFANKCMEENENGQTGVIRPLLKDIYKQLSTCTYED